MNSKRFKVQINYKSGISMITEVDSLKVTHGSNDEPISIIGEGMKPRPLNFNVNEIESVWQL